MSQGPDDPQAGLNWARLFRRMITPKPSRNDALFAGEPQPEAPGRGRAGTRRAAGLARRGELADRI